MLQAGTASRRVNFTKLNNFQTANLSEEKKVCFGGLFFLCGNSLTANHFVEIEKNHCEKKKRCLPGAHARMCALPAMTYLFYEEVIIRKINCSL